MYNGVHFASRLQNNATKHLGSLHVSLCLLLEVYDSCFRRGTRFPGGMFCRGFEALGQEIVQIDPRSPCSETESPWIQGATGFAMGLTHYIYYPIRA